MVPLSSQQSLVLLPLTSFAMSPVCGLIDAPAGMTTQTAACLSKWAINGLPYGVPFTLLGCLLIRVCAEMDCKDDKFGNILQAISLLGGSTLAISGIIMVLFWLFGGIILGAWMAFGSWEVLTDLALIKLLRSVICDPDCDAHNNLPSISLVLS